jgi:hypothetical protein
MLQTYRLFDTLASMTVRIGYKASAEQFGPRELLVFHAPGADQARFFEQLSADVLPLVRERFSRAVC